MTVATKTKPVTKTKSAFTRTSSKIKIRPVLRITRGKPGKIMMMREIKSSIRPNNYVKPSYADVPWDKIKPGYSVFLPNAVNRHGLAGRNQRYINVCRYTRNGTMLWATRTLVENGVLGIRIYRVA